MIVPIRCFTCNNLIADKYDYYMNEKAKLDDDTEETKEILDKLGLIRYCCRRHMITTLDMMALI